MPEAEQLTYSMREEVKEFVIELTENEEKIDRLNKKILSFANSNEVAKRLLKVPGIGPLTATAIVA